MLLLFSLSSDQWCVVCFRAFWTCCGKVWGPDVGVEAQDFEAGKYIGYTNINDLSPARDWWKLQETGSFETHATAKQNFWYDDSLNINVTLLWALVHASHLKHAWTVQCTIYNGTSSQHILPDYARSKHQERQNMVLDFPTFLFLRL